MSSLNLSIDSLESAEELEAIIIENRLKYENHIEPQNREMLEDTIYISLSSHEQARDPYASYSFEIEYSYEKHNYIVTTTRSPEEVGSESAFEDFFQEPGDVAGYIASYSVIKWFNNKLSPDEWSLLDAVLHNRVEDVKALAEKGIDINIKDIHGNSCLITAVKNCDYRIVELLLSLNPDLKVSDSNGNTALHWSIIKNKNDLFHLLIKHGADIHAVNSYGENSLMTAASWNNEEALNFFLQHGFDVNLKNNDGEDALKISISMGHEKIARILLENGARLKPCDAQRYLAKASELGHDEIAAFLIESGAVVDEAAVPEPDIPLSGRTPLMDAAYIGNNKVITLLIKKGANPNLQNTEGKTALMFAAEGNNARSGKLLLDAGADLEMTDNHGKNALCLALESCSTTAAGYLIKRGARIDSIRERDDNMKQCIELMEQEKETLEQLISNDLESTD